MWPKHLPALLSPGVHKCFAHLKLDEVTDYDKVKEVILADYRPEELAKLHDLFK